MNKLYELVVLMHPDLEIDAEAPIKKIEGLVTAVGGRVAKSDNWGKKRLAYRIDKQDFAIYVYFELELDPTKVRDFENTILLTEEVLRHILVVHEEAKARPAKKTDSTEKVPAVAASKEASDGEKL